MMVGREIPLFPASVLCTKMPISRLLSACCSVAEMRIVVREMGWEGREWGGSEADEAAGEGEGPPEDDGVGEDSGRPRPGQAARARPRTDMEMALV